MDSQQGGLRGIAHEAARKIPHNELMTLHKDKKPTAGRRCLDRVRQGSLAAAIRASETFVLALYDRTARRSHSESMKRELDKLKELSAKTEVSDDPFVVEVLGALVAVSLLAVPASST